MYDRIILFPYFLTLKVKDSLYRKGTLKTSSAPQKTICIGNITVGGTGKTPHTEMVLRMLSDWGIWPQSRIAMLSRGYRRKGNSFREVPTDGSARMCGDEPLQVKKNVPGVTVAVCRNRIEGCAALGDKSDIVVLDDAFQYRKLKADVNIILVDSGRLVTEDRLLPFGRLRDLRERLADADMVIVTKCPEEMEDGKKDDIIRRLGLSGRPEDVWFTTVRYGELTAVFPEGDPRFVYSQRGILVTGIANDTPLRHNLNGQFRFLRRFHYPDHHRFTAADIRDIRKASLDHPTATIITTQKDAQRLLDIKEIPGQLRPRTFYAPIRAEFLSDEQKERFEARLRSLLGV